MIRNDFNETHYTFMRKCYDIFNKFESFCKRASENAFMYYIDKKVKEEKEKINKLQKIHIQKYKEIEKL